MTYARPLESLSSVVFFLSVILTVARGIRFMVIFKNRDTCNCSRAFDSVINIYIFLTVAVGIRTHYFPNLFSSKPRD